MDRNRQVKEMPKKGSGAKIAGIIAAAVLVCALVAGIWLSFGTVDAQTSSQGAYTLRDSIQDAAVQCFAIEGQYPPSLEYLEENYGVSINHGDYDIIYDVYASNVPPLVEVKVKDNG